MQSPDQLENTTSEFSHTGQLTASGVLDPKPKDASHSLEEPLAKLDRPTAEKDKHRQFLGGETKSTAKKTTSRGSVECCECKKIITRANYSRHVKKMHVNGVKCLYGHCALHFKSVKKKEQHEVLTC